MKPSRTIKYKALFLLVTFSLNSVVGFACSLGVVMGFNSGHHEHNDQEQHKHAQGHTESHRNDPHDHHGKKTHKHSHNHNDNKGHKHDAGNTVSFNEPADDNCCNDLVVDFHNLDKAVVKGNSSVQQQQIVLSPFVVPVILGLNNIKGFAQHQRIPPKQTDLPPPDILALIQSFLI